MALIRFVLVLALPWLATCGGKVETQAEPSDAAPQDTIATPGTCSWSSSFDPIDATPMRDSCRAARRLLSCMGSDGTGASCMTDKEECDLPTAPGVSYTCKNVCKSTEFAAKCGDLMGSSVVPPADCSNKLTPPGGTFYCCTCSM